MKIKWIILRKKYKYSTGQQYIDSLIHVLLARIIQRLWKTEASSLLKQKELDGSTSCNGIKKQKNL